VELELIRRLRHALAIVQPSALAVRAFRCPLCGPGLLVRLSRDPIGVRCLRCGASAITLSVATVLRAIRPAFGSERVYELSSRGPLFEFLRTQVSDLTYSECFDDVPPGAVRNGVPCQDVERLTFENASFDVCTSTEVFEHVPDDARGFSEIYRVLRPGGIFLFTVPLSDAERTVERARKRNGRVEHLLPPEYHGDRIRGQGRVLVFRDYGRDILQRLRSAGFSQARFDGRCKDGFLGFGRTVVVGEI
jgi:SAM-dependent methyltransferase